MPGDNTTAANEPGVAANDGHRAFFELLVDAIGVYLFIQGAWATWATLQKPLSIYDEGIVLAFSHLILAGQAPYRDFYTNYPPGIFLIIAGLWKIFGISGVIPRLLGAFLHLVMALLAGRIAGRVGGRSFSWLACGGVSLWMSFVAPVSYAWIAAMALALITIEIFLFLGPRRQPAAFCGAGLGLGAISGLRHDLFVYFCIALVLMLGFWIVREKAVPARAFWLRVGWAMLGAGVAVVVIWTPLVANAGFGQIARDLYFDQVQHIMPARRLPLPSLFGLVAGARLPFGVPVSLAKMFPAAVVLSLCAPACACLALAFAGFQMKERFALSLMSALALACLPQLLGRTDPEHAVFVMPPALIIGIGLVESFRRQWMKWWQRLLLTLAALLLFVFPVRTMLQPLSKLKQWGIPTLQGRFAGLIGAEQERYETLAFIRENTRPGEGIFVGTAHHRQIIYNDVSLYYLSDRVGVTRYVQFDPNIVTRLDVQQQIVSDLENKQVKIAILLQSGFFWDEPNESRKVGAGLLDDYLSKHYDNVGSANNYVWLRRKTAP